MRRVFLHHYLPRIGRLTLLDVLPRNRDYRRMCLVQCECGRQTKTQLRYYGNSHTRSCGRCAKKGRAHNRKHGHRPRGKKSPTYISWAAIHDRAGNPKFPAYLGVKVCERWSGPFGYQHFLADLGERQPGQTCGRFLDVGDYEPGNCKFMTCAEQKAEARKKKLLRRAMLDKAAQQKRQADEILRSLKTSRKRTT